MSDGSEEILLCSDDGAEQGLRGAAAADMQQGSHICAAPLPPLFAAEQPLLLEYKPFAQPLSAPADRVQPPLIILNPDPSLKRLQRHLVHLRAGPSVAEVLPKRDASAALASLDDSGHRVTNQARAIATVRAATCLCQTEGCRHGARRESHVNLLPGWWLEAGSQGPFCAERDDDVTNRSHCRLAVATVAGLDWRAVARNVGRRRDLVESSMC